MCGVLAWYAIAVLVVGVVWCLCADVMCHARILGFPARHGLLGTFPYAMVWPALSLSDWCWSPALVRRASAVRSAVNVPVGFLVAVVLAPARRSAPRFVRAAAWMYPS